MAHTRAVLAATVQDGVRHKTLHAAQQSFFVYAPSRLFVPLSRLCMPPCRVFVPLRRLTKRAGAAPQLFTVVYYHEVHPRHRTPHTANDARETATPPSDRRAMRLGMAWGNEASPVAGGAAGRTAPHSGHPRAPTVAPRTDRDSPAATLHGLCRLSATSTSARDRLATSARDRLATSAKN